MDADGLPIVGHGIDLTKVDAIHQKRTLTFLNHFITHTTNFLNRFSNICEEKLEAVSVRLQRLETIMAIVEAKLSSIPGLEDVTTETSEPSAQSDQTDTPSTNTADEPTTEPEVSVIDSTEQAQPAAPTKTALKDPRYARFFRMMSVGVPIPAIKMKMQQEGLNPDLLDTPNAAITDGADTGNSPAASEDDDFSEHEETSDDSSGGFSD